MYTQPCGCWCPGTKAPGYQHPQCWWPRGAYSAMWLPISWCLVTMPPAPPVPVKCLFYWTNFISVYSINDLTPKQLEHKGGYSTLWLLISWCQSTLPSAPSVLLKYSFYWTSYIWIYQLHLPWTTLENITLRRKWQCCLRLNLFAWEFLPQCHWLWAEAGLSAPANWSHISLWIFCQLNF